MSDYPNTAVIDLHYLPSLEYFACLLRYDTVRLERYEYYEKQTYRNRSRILTSNKIDTLSVPVQEGSSKILIKDLRIDYRQDWVRRHWGAITSGYGKAAFFEFYADRFERVYHQKPVFLFDLNWEMLTICLDFLKIDKSRIIFTEKYEKFDSQEVIDLRSVISPKISANFRNYYRPVAYRQNFGNNFEPNLSMLDLLFCHGSQAKAILMQSSAY